MAPSSHVVIASVTVCAVVAIGVCYLCMRKKRRDGDGYDGPGQAPAGTAATAGAAAAANGETRVPLLFSQSSSPSRPRSPSASADQQAAAGSRAAEAARAARQKQWEEERRQAEAEPAEEAAAVAAAANKRARKEGGGGKGGRHTGTGGDQRAGIRQEGNAHRARSWRDGSLSRVSFPHLLPLTPLLAQPGATLVLEVISGPASGGSCSGRWEVVDRGSLNGTLLNDEAINAEAERRASARRGGRASWLMGT
ncbi:unnamed protein product [Closterium sp. NIES-65]|nr:unnamed protein product [Closterium sp. NIES-65]